MYTLLKHEVKLVAGGEQYVTHNLIYVTDEYKAHQIKYGPMQCGLFSSAIVGMHFGISSTMIVAGIVGYCFGYIVIHNRMDSLKSDTLYDFQITYDYY